MSGFTRLVLLSAAVLASTYGQLTPSHLDLFRGFNVTITDDTTEPNLYWIFNHHGIPNHDYGPFPSSGNPNEVSVQDHMFKIPKTPVMADPPGCLGLSTIAVAINGVPVFNPYTGTGYNAVEGPNRETFDSCTGHPQNSGVYHYHTVPQCLYTGQADQLIGVALDGYPIYGVLDGATGKNLTSADLDACHGRNVSGKYEYRLTHDYPYVMGCYRGVSTAMTPGQMGGRKRRQAGQRPPPGQGGPGGGQGRRPPRPRVPCVYVTFCENPANGCPCSAYEWNPNAPRQSNETCSTTSMRPTTTRNLGEVESRGSGSPFELRMSVVLSAVFVVAAMTFF